MPRVKNGVSREFRLITSLLFTALILTGCGGGGGSDSGSGPKSSFTAGPITGFGSVIVNGTRFDASNATVTDDEGRVYREDDLKLGMMAEVQAGDIAGDNTGQATEIRFGSAIIGPVDAINTSTRLLVVLGQTIDVSDTTVFGDSLPAGPFDIVVGDVLEIFGMLDTTTGHYMATRIEAKPDASLFKIRGKVSDLDLATRTFLFGSETVSFANLPGDQVPALSNGMEVIASLQMTQNRNGEWVATQIRTATDRPVTIQGKKVKLKGFVTSIDSPVYFTVDGIPVDASDAKIRPKKSRLTVGSHVKVEGAASGGTIIATKVHIKRGGRGGDDDDHDDDDEDDEYDGFELHGAVDRFDASTRTFVVRGVRVSFSGPVVFEKGSQNALKAGSRIEVKAKLSSNGTQLDAVHISFED